MHEGSDLPPQTTDSQTLHQISRTPHIYRAINQTRRHVPMYEGGGGHTAAWGNVVRLRMPGIHTIPRMGRTKRIQRVTIEALTRYEYTFPSCTHRHRRTAISSARPGGRVRARYHNARLRTTVFGCLLPSGMLTTGPPRSNALAPACARSISS